MRKVAKWVGIVWVATPLAFLAVISPIEYLTGRALIIPAWDDIGTVTLFSLGILPGVLLYIWGRAPEVE